MGSLCEPVCTRDWSCKRPGGGGVLPIMACTGRLRPKGEPFSGFRYRSFSVTWSAALQIPWNKRKFSHVKRVQFPLDFFAHKHGRRFIVLYTNMAAVTSCENYLYEGLGNLLVEVYERVGKSVI